MKFNVKKFVIILAIIMVVSFIIATTVFFTTGGLSVTKITSNRIEETKNYKIQGIDNIDISTVSSAINIFESDVDEIEILFYGDVSSNLSRSMPELKTEISGSDLIVFIDHPKALTIGIVNFMELKLDVMIPKDYEGDMQISSTSGNLNIDISKLKDLKFNGVSGSVYIKSLAAENMDIESTSGRFRMDDIEGRIKAANLSGEISIDLKNLTGDIDVNSISGNVTVKIPEENGFKLDAESISGVIENDFNSSIDYADDKNLEATVGNGDHDIQIKTTSGNIKINKK